MIINDTPFNTDLETIMEEWQSQLHLNNIPYIQKYTDTPGNIMIPCLYHKNGQERKPSMGISKKDGVCHCFTCGKVAGLPEAISYSFGQEQDLTGSFGWQWLLKNFLTIEVEERKDVDIDYSRNNSLHDNRTVNYVSEEELDKYRFYHDYMWKRKLTPEVVELFDIGYDKETNCITFPNRDVNGNCLFVARRSVSTKFFNYPSDVEKPVYGLYELEKISKHWDYRVCALERKSQLSKIFKIDEIIICESMLDALTCWVYGKYAVALNGLGTQKQFTILRNLECRKFILATDMDEAGQRARANIRKALNNKIVTEYVWDVNVAKDVNDMSKEYFDSLREIM